MSTYKNGDAVGLFRIKQRTNAYTGVAFRDSERVHRYKVGDVIRVTEIVRYKQQYRLKTSDKLFVSAEKEVVEKV